MEATHFPNRKATTSHRRESSWERAVIIYGYVDKHVSQLGLDSTITTCNRVKPSTPKLTRNPPLHHVDMATLSRPRIVLGAAAVGGPSVAYAKYTTPKAAQEFINICRSYGHDTIDTARSYPGGSASGTSEQILGETDFATWAVLDTKVYSHGDGCHTASRVKESIDASLAALKVSKVHIMYLHGPDRTTPYKETCQAMNDAYDRGKFEKYGLSNFTPDEVDEMVEICETNDWVKPTVYQGHYNAIARLAEDDLIPTCRKHGIAYYAFSPSAAGMFSGKVNAESIHQPGTRWDKDTGMGKMYGEMYLKDQLLSAANRVHEVASKQGISGHAAALRWLLWHAKLDGQSGDAIILGASSLEQLKQNLDICEQGPLSKDLVKVIEEVWPSAREFAPPAWD